MFERVCDWRSCGSGWAGPAKLVFSGNIGIIGVLLGGRPLLIMYIQGAAGVGLLLLSFQCVLSFDHLDYVLFNISRSRQST